MNALVFPVIQGIDGKPVLIQDAVGAGMSALRQGAGTGVQQVDAFADLTGRDMRVTGQEHIPGLQAGQMLRTIDMPMAHEDLPAAQIQDVVIGGYREIQDHLVHFGITVAADGSDLLMERIEPGNDFLRGVVCRQFVARPVIQDIPQAYVSIASTSDSFADMAWDKIKRELILGQKPSTNGDTVRSR